MNKLTLTTEETNALAEAWEEQLPEETTANRIAEYKLLKNATRSQVQKFYQLLIMKTNAEQKEWRKWFIRSGLIKWLVQCEAENGIKGLAARIKSEYGQLVDEYDLKTEFNKAYTDVINEYK